MLLVRSLDAWYGDIQILWGVSLEVHPGEVVTVVGANTAGKTTLLRAISGVMVRRQGEVSWLGERLDTAKPHLIVERGIVHVPEGRRLFNFMSVEENLLMGNYSRSARAERALALAEVYELLPLLAERRTQLAGSLSGGEQQMLAIGRGLMARPKVLMLDEPSLGLAPLFVAKVFDLVAELRARGLTVLLVEQNVHHALRLADRAYVLEQGRVVLEGSGTALAEDEGLRRAYMGI